MRNKWDKVVLGARGMLMTMGIVQLNSEWKEREI